MKLKSAAEYSVLLNLKRIWRSTFSLVSTNTTKRPEPTMTVSTNKYCGVSRTGCSGYSPATEFYCFNKTSAQILHWVTSSFITLSADCSGSGPWTRPAAVNSHHSTKCKSLRSWGVPNVILLFLKRCFVNYSYSQLSFFLCKQWIEGKLNCELHCCVSLIVSFKSRGSTLINLSELYSEYYQL